MSESRALLEISDLSVTLGADVPIIEGINLTLGKGQILGLVGESGSGKSTLALAMLGFAKPGGRIVPGSITVNGEEILGRPESELRGLRGRLVSYVPQDPQSSLNPSRRIGQQINDRLQHRPTAERQALVTQALERAQLPSNKEFLSRFPHQMSGGQQQRVLIAMAIVDEPALVVLDEPTTGLDVVTQAGILEEIRRLRDELDIGIVYVTHDLAAVASVADSLVVMYAGRIVESGDCSRILARPRHPYTVGLLESVPDHSRPARLRGLPGVAVGIGDWPVGCAFAARCSMATDECRSALPPLERVEPPADVVRCLKWRDTPLARVGESRSTSEASTSTVLSVSHLKAGYGRGKSELLVARDVSFAVHAGECVALVGESGSGKTTIARCVAGLRVPFGGQILLGDTPLAGRARDRKRDQLRRVQFIFQNPYESLNPRHLVGESITEAAMILRDIPRAEAEAETERVLAEVRLPARIVQRFPGELSGGERQRVAIARALVAQPDLLVCDEITSALDVSVQAAVLDLLNDLRSRLGLAMLFITHDLGVVASTADRVIVLKEGEICETGSTEQVLEHPSNAYTKLLLDSAPLLSFEEHVSQAPST
jgi:peptide/nickel transport system ATP-binding protein